MSLILLNTRVVLSVLGIGAPVISFIFLLFLMLFFVFLVRVIITIGAATRHCPCI